MDQRPDGGIRIAWHADGYEAIDVYARWRPREELAAFASGVADAALFDRSVADLRSALRRIYPGEFDLVLEPHDRTGPRVVVRFHPPKGEPNPEPV
jgi:hypothetical protein